MSNPTPRDTLERFFPAMFRDDRQALLEIEDRGGQQPQGLAIGLGLQLGERQAVAGEVQIGQQPQPMQHVPAMRRLLGEPDPGIDGDIRRRDPRFPGNPGAPSMKTAVIETPKGRIKLEIFPKDAPKTVENFETLAK